MTHHASTKFVIRSIAAFALTLTVLSPAQVRSAEPAKGKSMTELKLMERCQELKEQKQRMKEDMKAQDAELAELVAKLKSAPADKKMDLLAAVVTQMGEQRIAMDARKARMDEDMMNHMMQHVQMGKDSLSECPLMNGMKEKNDNSAGAKKDPQGDPTWWSAGRSVSTGT